MMKTRALVLAALTMLALGALAAVAQEQKPAGDMQMSPQAKAEMEAMMKAGTPSDAHKPLGRYVGDWTFTNTMWMEPGKPPMKSDGTIHGAWILDGRYVESVYKGDMMGQPFEGHSTDGYDNAAKQYVGTWVDSMSTGIMYATGTCTDGGKVCTMSGTMTDPMSGKPTTSRSVTTWTGDDSFTMEMFGPDRSGHEMKFMELVATRKK